MYPELIRQCANDRAEFVRHFLLGEMSDDIEAWQLDFLKALDNGAERLAVRSGHGVGKTCFLAWCIIHFMFTRFPQKTIVTAPTKGQLYDALAAETKKWLQRMPPPLRDMFEVFNDRIELKESPESSFCGFRTSRDDRPEALQGIHAEHVLMIVDEASGVSDEVYQAAGGSMSSHGAIMILAGNPTRASGYFYNIFKSLNPDWKQMTVPCRNSTRVGEEYPRQMAAMYREDSNVYRIRVLGLPPLFDDDKLIPLDLIEGAVGRDIVDMRGRVWGLDIARGGNDRCVLVERRGRVVTSARHWRGQDLMKTAGLVKQKFDELRDDEKPIAICVDACGLGAGVSDRLSELGLPARAVNVAESSAMNDQAQRLRDDLWLQCRDWFMTKAVSIPDIPELVLDLSAPTFEITEGGKYKVASKEKMKRDGFSSPDYADALCLTFAEDPITALYGSGAGSYGGWNDDLHIEQPTVM